MVSIGKQTMTWNGDKPGWEAGPMEHVGIGLTPNVSQGCCWEHVRINFAGEHYNVIADMDRAEAEAMANEIRLVLAMR